MKLADLREAYKDYSRRAGDIVRQLAFAGIAVVWLFRVEDSGQPHLDPDFVGVAFLLVLTLTFDLFQYAFGTLILGSIARWKENRVEEDATFKIPRQANWPALSCLWLKIITGMVAYCWLLVLLFRRLV